MRRRAVVLLSVLLTIGPALAVDWFPLEVGNRWSYRCEHVVQGPCGVEGQGCFCREGDLLELSVIDTVRVDLSSVSGPTRFSDVDLPRSAAGTLYYVLSGSGLFRLVPHWDPTPYSGGSLLVRQTSGAVGIHMPPPDPAGYEPELAQALVVGGWRLTTGYELYGQAELLFDFLADQQWHPGPWSPGCCHDTSMEMWGPQDYTGAYPAGEFAPLSFVDVQPSCACNGWRLVFAPNVGLAAIATPYASDFYTPSTLYYVLTDAVVNGVRYPRSSEIESRTWGQVRTEAR